MQRARRIAIQIALLGRADRAPSSGRPTCDQLGDALRDRAPVPGSPPAIAINLVATCS